MYIPPKALTLLFAAALIFSFAAHDCLASATAPSIIPASPPDASAKRVRKLECAVTGHLYCSEYGYRYKEPLLVVFQDGEDRFLCPISEKDGAFSVMIPAGKFSVRVEFQGKGIEAGTMDVPLEPCAREVELYQSGSMLELVWQIRDEGGAYLGIKIKELPAPQPAGQ